MKKKLEDQDFIIQFGKHKNKKISEILKIDPGYLKYLADYSIQLEDDEEESEDEEELEELDSQSNLNEKVDQENKIELKEKNEKYK